MGFSKAVSDAMREAIVASVLSAVQDESGVYKITEEQKNDFVKSVTQNQLTAGQYFAEEFPKKQIVMHHTAGRANPKKTIMHWEHNDIQVATAFVVGGKEDGSGLYFDGEIAQAHSTRYWAYHTGPKNSDFQKFNLPWQRLDKYNIGIEVCNWGYLDKKDGKYYSYVGAEVPEEETVHYPNKFKGKEYYHKYTDAQVESLKSILIYLSATYKIPLVYDEYKLWEQNEYALGGEPGLYTHNSFIEWKSDLHPQPEVIAMLKSICK